MNIRDNFYNDMADREQKIREGVDELVAYIKKHGLAKTYKDTGTNKRTLTELIERYSDYEILGDHPSIDIETTKKVREMYLDGYTKVKIGKALGITQKKVNDAIEKQIRSSNHRANDIHIEKIYGLYADGEPMRVIGAEIGIHTTTVGNVLQKMLGFERYDKLRVVGRNARFLKKSLKGIRDKQLEKDNDS